MLWDSAPDGEHVVVFRELVGAAPAGWVDPDHDRSPGSAMTLLRKLRIEASRRFATKSRLLRWATRSTWQSSLPAAKKPR